MNQSINAEMVRSVMVERGFTAAHLAAAGDVSLRTLTRLFNEPNRKVTAATAGRLAAALDIPVNLIVRHPLPRQRHGITANT